MCERKESETLRVIEGAFPKKLSKPPGYQLHGGNHAGENAGSRHVW